MRRRSDKPVQIAEKFGRALDHDDFGTVKKLVDPECVYSVGENQFTGPDAIAESYETNMLEGREKLDELVWGNSFVEEVEPDEFIIHFTDHIKHKGQSFIHRSKQRITIGPDSEITRIDHVDDPNESVRLKTFFEKVGIDS